MEKCGLCSNKPHYLLPNCYHRICDVCLGDVIGEMGCICQVYPTDCDIICGKEFKQEEIITLSSLHEDEQEENEEKQQQLDDIKNIIQQKANGMTQGIASLDELSIAIWHRKNETLRAIEKSFDAITKAVEIKRDQLVVQRDHFQPQTTGIPSHLLLNRLLQLEEQKIDMLLPDVEIPTINSVAKTLPSAFPSVCFSNFGRDYSQVTDELKLVFEVDGPGCALFDKNDDMLISTDSCIKRYNRQGQFICNVIVGLSESAHNIVMSPIDGNLWVLLYGRNVVTLYDSASGIAIRSLSFQHDVCCMALTPDGNEIVVATNRREVIVYSANAIEDSQRWLITVPRENGYVATINNVATTNNKVIVCDTSNHQLLIFSLVDGSFLRKIDELRWPFDISYVPQSQLLLVGENDRVSVCTLDSVKLHTWKITAEMSSCGPYICVSPFDGIICVCDLSANCVKLY